jgi:hypothetical protein
MKMREASEREANGAEKTEENRERERERELLICPELVLYSCMNSIFLHEQFMTH